MGVRKNDGLVVLLISGVKTIARTATNQFGEFQLEFESIEDPGLQNQAARGLLDFPCIRQDGLGQEATARLKPSTRCQGN